MSYNDFHKKIVDLDMFGEMNIRDKLDKNEDALLFDMIEEQK